MTKLVFICGPHASGKTTIINKLKENGLVSGTGNEIGKELYYQRNFKTEKQGPDFEFEIANLELERDRRLLKKGGVVVVETWHVGNLAYADLRNQEIIQDLIILINSSPFIKEAYCIWLRIPKEEIVNRTKTFEDRKEWVGDFYEAIDNNIGKYLASLNLLERTSVIDATRCLDDVYNDVRKSIFGF